MTRLSGPAITEKIWIERSTFGYSWASQADLGLKIIRRNTETPSHTYQATKVRYDSGEKFSKKIINDKDCNVINY